jgi:hypothetical protein
MNRQQAMAKATHIRKDMTVWERKTDEVTVLKTISEAKRFSRSLGLTCVALADDESLVKIRQAE